MLFGPKRILKGGLRISRLLHYQQDIFGPLRYAGRPRVRIRVSCCIYKARRLQYHIACQPTNNTEIYYWHLDLYHSMTPGHLALHII